jgi:thiamine biosynthesis protein ThiS
LPVPIDYVLAGHLYPTSTHPNTPPLGVDGLRAIVQASTVPVVAIGGITPDNVGGAVEAGSAGVAVLSYVNSSDRPDLAARELRDTLERAMSQVAAALTVQVNGKSMSVAAGTTLTTFLESRNLHPRLVVVEHNREIVARSAYDSTVLEEGDLLEIAHFVGGG